ncbi:MAG: hypothetical protein ACI4EK_02965 [Wujia sp.]
MWKKLKEHKGYSVVEISLILPLLLGICFLVISLFLDIIGDAYIQQRCYSLLYVNANDIEENDKGSKLVATLQYGGQNLDVTCICNQKELRIEVNKADAKRILDYESKKRGFAREKNQSAKRMRRWQIYGDHI